jgi:hypothetical protein
MQLLGKNKDANIFSFYKEVQNLEFTEKIGNIKRYFCTDSQKRDKALVKIGKRLLKKKSEDRILIIRFIKGGISIYYKDKSYKFGFFEEKRHWGEAKSHSKEEDGFLREVNRGDNELSQEEINMLLSPEEEEE